MVDLAHISPEQKNLVIHGDANYQFIYINHQPIHIGRLNQELVDTIGNIYNGSVNHERILEMHTPLIDLLKETNIDKVSVERINPIIKNLISYDYAMFIDLMTILAAMLEAKDIEKKSKYIDCIVEFSDNIVTFNSSDTADTKESD